MSNPITPTDRTFLKYFAIMIAFLGVVALGLGALGMYVAHRNPPMPNPAHRDSQVARIAPVGGVYAGDTGQAAMLAAQEAAKQAAASQVAYGGTTDGKTIFDQLCHACHVSGAGGSPRISDKAEWVPRIAEGVDTLVRHAIEGYTGEDGFMPPKGGNPALTREDLADIVAYLRTLQGR